MIAPICSFQNHGGLNVLVVITQQQAEEVQTEIEKVDRCKRYIRQIIVMNTNRYQ
jgi:hypothetical protein